MRGLIATKGLGNMNELRPVQSEFTTSVRR